MSPMLRRVASRISSSWALAWGTWSALGVLWVLSAWMALWPQVALAAEPSAQVRAALEVLAASPVGSGAPVAAAPAGSPASASAPMAPGVAVDALGQPRQTVEVARGQTLETVLRAHLGKSPLKPEVVREVVVKLNPQVLGADGRKRPVAGAKLQLPTIDDLVRHAFGGTQAHNLALATQAAMAAQADAAGGVHGAAAAARRGWVRYP